MLNQLNTGDRMKYFEALYLPVFFLIIGLILCFACLIKPDFALMMLAVNFILAPSIAIGALIQDLKTQETE
jgi:membrane protein implicated in regulation of membrane protease activity